MRATVQRIGPSGRVELELSAGGTLTITVDPDGPIEIVLPEGEGTANMVGVLGCVPAEPRERTGHRVRYVLPTKWAPGKVYVDGTLSAKCGTVFT